MSERCGTVGQSFSPVLAPKRHWEVLLKEGMMAQKACVRVWDPLTEVTLFPSWAQQQPEQVSQGSPLLALPFRARKELGKGRMRKCWERAENVS